MRTGILLLSACLVLITADVVAGPIEPPGGIRRHEPGPAPGFSLAGMDGDTFALESVRGKWVFLHFWASWCGPCRDEMPAIQQMKDSLANDGPEIVLVNTAETEDTVFSFLGEIGMDMNSLMDADGLVTEQYKPRGLPTTILIDPEGNVRYQAIGGREWHQPEYLAFLRALAARH